MNPWDYARDKNEHANQVALFMWLNMAANFGFEVADIISAYEVKGFAAKYGGEPVPDLHLAFAIHNQGHGDKIRGARAKAEGLKKGVPDIFIPVPKLLQDNLWCHGLFIELKVGDGKTSAEQNDWLDNLTRQGYKTVVCYGWIAASLEVKKYFDKSYC